MPGRGEILAEAETLAAANGGRQDYDRIRDLARGDDRAAVGGTAPAAMHTREHRARGYAQQLGALYPETMSADRPQVTLAKRIRRYLQDLFVFGAVPGVPHTNNAAERSLRPLVIARKVSDGTRSAAGSTCRVILDSIAATARLRTLDPTDVFFPPGVTARGGRTRWRQWSPSSWRVGRSWSRALLPIRW